MKTKIALAAVAAIAATCTASADDPHDSAHSSFARSGHSPLVEKVHNANERFKDLNVATGEGWVQGTPCVSGPEFGAMGVHFVKPERIAQGVLNAETPQALIYEPTGNGYYRLVGAEFIILADVWTAAHPDSGPPALDGHLLNFVNAPNRYGLPAFYELHVWAWENNPSGSFADFNARVTCDKQRAS
jgi:hypothetical protein